MPRLSTDRDLPYNLRQPPARRPSATPCPFPRVTSTLFPLSCAVLTWLRAPCNTLPAAQIPAGQMYKTPGEAYVEGDASSASYFLAGATITGGTITVEGCGSDSLQGDVRFAEVGRARLPSSKPERAA